MRDFFRKKIYCPDIKTRCIVTVFIALWSFLVLYALQPFGINFAKNKFTIVVINTIGVLGVCVVYIQILPLIFKKYIPRVWTNGCFFIIYFFAITVFALLDTFVLSMFIDKLEGIPYHSSIPVLRRFIGFYGASFFTSVFPVASIYVWIKKKEGEEQRISLMQKESQAVLLGKTKDQIKLFPEDILYAKASGNYVAVYYQGNEGKSHKLLRISMSELDEMLCDYPYVVRCHRTFMINVKQIEKIHGNLRGYSLELKNTDEEIPVSKSYTRDVKEKISPQLLLYTDN